MQINNFNQAHQALNQFISPWQETVPYTLSRMKQLMDYLDNPQNKIRIIHIAGTSGKTSTAYYAASLLTEAGYRVGLTVSPSIDEVNERAQINLLPLLEPEYCQELNEFLDLVDKSGIKPSYYEILIAFAYWLFDKYHVEYAVVEVGLGGLLDCTNVVDQTNKTCIITDIDLDHTNILGKTIGEIAYQKAGIIQSKNTVFIYNQAKVITKVVQKRCFDKNANLRIIQSDYHIDDILTSLPLFQRHNFKLALKAVTYAISRDHNRALSTEEIQKASRIKIPGRMEIAPYRGKIIVLDGSHNKQKISALVDAIRQKFSDKSITVLVAFGAGKQSSAFTKLKLLSSVSSKIILTKFYEHHSRTISSADPKMLELCAKKAGFTTVIIELNPQLALKLLEKDTAEIGLITGSFYLLSAIRPIVTR